MSLVPESKPSQLIKVHLGVLLGSAFHLQAHLGGVSVVLELPAAPQLRRPAASLLVWLEGPRVSSRPITTLPAVLSAALAQGLDILLFARGTVTSHLPRTLSPAPSSFSRRAFAFVQVRTTWAFLFLLLTFKKAKGPAILPAK